MGAWVVAGRAFAIGIALLGATMAAPAVAAPAQLLYAHDGHVWTIGADGSGRARLPLPADAGDATWTADGQSLVVTYGARDHVTHVGLVAPSGGAPREIATLRDPSGVALSPDGSRLAYAHQYYGKDRIVSNLIVQRLDGSDRRLLAHAVYSERSYDALGTPVWSPDGGTLLYTRSSLVGDGYSGYALHAIAPDGSGDHVLTDSGEGGAFSPDGRQIAFTSRRDKNGDHATGSDESDYDGEIYVMNADGSGQRRLTERVGDDSEPSWSADGRTIAFSSDANLPASFDLNAELWSVGVDGSCLTQLTNGTPASLAPAWRPGDSGMSAPSACGAPPPPQVDVSVPKASEVRALWLGPQFGPLLLDSAERDRGGLVVGYEDCAAATPSGCPPTLDVQTHPICDRREAEDALLFGRHPRRVHGALVLDYPDESGVDTAHATLLLTGGASVYIGRRKGSPPLSAFLAALRPVGGAVPRRFAGPALPRSVVRLVQRAAAVRRRAASLTAAAKQLHTAPWQVGERLRMARTLSHLGPYRRLPC